MKKLFLCLVVLMSMEQVFAARIQHQTTGMQAAEGLIQIKAQNIANMSTSTLREIPDPLIPDDHTKNTIAELLDQVDSPSYCKFECIKIANSISDEKSRALVTLIRSTIGGNIRIRSNIYTLKGFHDLLFLADYYPSVEDATLAFSNAPKSFLPSISICSDEIDTRKFAKSLGLVFVISNCKKYPYERVLSVAEVMCAITEEETKLSEANTIEEALITIAQNNTEELLNDLWIEKCNHIASCKTEEENRALAQLVKTTMKRHETFKFDSDLYCNFPQYSVFQFYRYLKVANYYPSVSDAEQAFSSAPAQINLLLVLERL